MAERLVRHLAISEAIQIEIKSALIHNNKLYVKWFDISDRGGTKMRYKSPLNTIRVTAEII